LLIFILCDPLTDQLIEFTFIRHTAHLWLPPCRSFISP
jgi:hypothetical protein